MARQRVYATDEERRAAIKAIYQQYKSTHREARAAHNKAYCQREDVKQRKRELRVARTLALRNSKVSTRVSADPNNIGIDEE